MIYPVTDVYLFDFYLQAHGGLQGQSPCMLDDAMSCSRRGFQGTTRPTHYYVLWDEIKFTADQIQTLTHEVSYLFARATKGVRIPFLRSNDLLTSIQVSLCSPAYYADIACERGRCYLHALMQGITNTNTTTASSAAREREEAKIMEEATHLWHGGLHKDLKVIPAFGFDLVLLLKTVCRALCSICNPF
jgi:eukaryotic translation initiation factor 2C